MIRNQFKKILFLFQIMVFKLSPLFYFKLYFILKGEYIKIRQPRNINEIIIYEIIYNSEDKLRVQCTDKYRVREYVKSKGLEKILIKLIGVYDNVEQIEFGSLPEQYVLKANHGCGFNIFCTKTKKLDVDDIKKKLSGWIINPLPIGYLLEPHYKNIEPKIICEEYINELGNTLYPMDYKIHCFYGEPKFILCIERSIVNGKQEAKKTAFDLNWNKLDCVKEIYESSTKIEKPSNLNEMIAIAKKLSTPFPFVRVDLYSINGKVYFGEMTFTPQGGIMYTFKRNFRKLNWS